MILPIIAAISRDTLMALPFELRQEAVALGATRWETILRVLVPAGLSGIVGASVLALGRALGETMATVMLIGNSNLISLSLLAPGSTIAALIANQFPEAKELQVASLLYAALVLMTVTLLINVLAELIVHRSQKFEWLKSQVGNVTAPLLHPVRAIAKSNQTRPHSELIPLASTVASSRKIFNFAMTIIVVLCTVVTLLFLGSILFNLASKGFNRLDLAVFTQLPPAALESGGGFRNAIVGTLVTVGIGALLSVPLGILTAIYLVEFGQGSKLANLVHF